MAIHRQTPRPCKHAGCPALVRDGAYCSKHRRDATATPDRSEQAQEWHKLYSCKWWKDARMEQLIKEPFCRHCAAAGVRTPAEDVDHIIPHRGDISMFKDSGNLQSLCHRCHSRKTMEETGR